MNRESPSPRGHVREPLIEFDVMLEASPDAMVVADADGNIVAVNAQTAAMFGYTKAELVGQKLELLIPERFRLRHPGHRASYFATPKVRRMGTGLELDARRKDGSEIPVEISLSPVDTSGGPVAIAAIRDVTERREQFRKIREASRLKSEFLANMSHELRTPLNAIIGFSELMHDGKVGPLAEEHREFLGDILTSARQLLRLINDVLDLAKIESGKMTFRPENVDLARLIAEVADALRSPESNGITIEVEPVPPIGPLEIDPVKLRQVLYNYLSNAVKFTPDGGRVTVGVRPEGAEHIRLEVRDTGIGIPPGDFGKLFVEFQQLDATATKKYRGTGLGLALTKRIVEAQGGKVGFSSEPGRGSVFFAVLPRIGSAGGAPSAS